MIYAFIIYIILLLFFSKKKNEIKTQKFRKCLNIPKMDKNKCPKSKCVNETWKNNVVKNMKNQIKS
jgi:hypothetical protein